MYFISKRMEIAGSHYLKLDYPSKCENDHGHNWIITVHCKSKNLDQNGMLVDFTEIKKKIHDELDHQCLNEVLDFNPTAENMAKWICDQVKYCYRIEVQESEGNIAVYEKI